MSFTIVQDTKEKKAWDLAQYELCAGIKNQGLTTGDYTVVGCEDILRIERKASTSEISGNLGKKWRQFEDEMIRMEEFEHRYLIMEFNEEDVWAFPHGSGIPKKFWKKLVINGKIMMRRLIDIKEIYGVELIFAGNKIAAEWIALEIMEEVYESTQKS